ncbi:MAG: S-layer homology domain-containing protein [Candidatus Altimarinota bacterium]
MKNLLFKSALATLLAQFFIMPSALAADPALYFPADAPYYLELDTNQQHPFKDMLKDLLIDNLEIDTDTAEAKILLENIDKTKLAIGLMEGRINSQPIMLSALSLDQASFDKLIQSEAVDSSDLGSGRKVYQIEEDFYFTYLGGNLIASNEFGLISDLLLTKNSNNLYQSPGFQNFNNNIQNSGFLKVYLNLEKLFSSEGLDPDQIPALMHFNNLFKTEGISLQQNINGFNAEVYVELSPESGYPINSLLFIPEIYKKINAENLAYYQESYNLATQTTLLSSMFGLDEELDIMGEVKSFLESELNLNWDTDLAPLLQKRSAIIMHNSNELIPALSLVTEVSNSSIAQNTNQKLIDKLTEILNEEIENSYQIYLEEQKYLQEYYPDQFEVTKSIAEFSKGLLTITKSSSNGSFTTFTLNSDPQAENYLPEPKITITLGVTTSGYWVLTLGDVNNLFNTNGLLEDSEFNKHYQNRNQKVTDIAFVNFSNITNYLKNFSKLMAVGSENSELPEEFNLFLDPLQSMFSETVSLGNNTLKSNIKLNLDISKLSNYQELFERLMSSEFINDFDEFEAPDLATAIEFTPDHCLNFNDVNSSDWFSSYVTDICFEKIMTGYDNQFKPNQAITRAEFIKAVMSAQDQLGYFYTTVEPEKYFSDVNQSEWYAFSINKARAHQIIDGFSDNTFRPNQPITRAEAIQIIYNLNEHSTTHGNPNFQDVSMSDWFYKAVAYGKEAGLVSGKTTSSFAPQDNLTRAETAKIISNYLYAN